MSSFFISLKPPYLLTGNHDNPRPSCKNLRMPMKHEQLRNINDQREILRIEKAKKKAKIEEFRAWDG